MFESVGPLMGLGMVTFSINFLTVEDVEQNEESWAASSSSSKARKSSLSFFSAFSNFPIKDSSMES